MAYGVDKWLMPITLTASNNKFRLFEITGSVEIIVTVATGTYYLHTSTNATYPGLYKAILNGIVAAGTAAGTYAFEVSTPELSYQQVGGGVRLTSDVTFSINVDDADFTMEPRWFGRRAGDGNVVSTTGPSNEFFASDHTVYGQWLSYNEHGGIASDKTSRKVRNSYRSHGRPSDAYLVTWNRDTNRKMRYEHVPAAHIFEDRATGDVTADLYASVGRLAPGDGNNAFETIWDNGLRKLEPVIIIQDDGHERVDLAGNYDVVRMIDEGKARDFDEVIRLMRLGGEYYEIDPGDLYIETSTYGH